MKLTETTILAAFFASMIGTASFAGIFDLPAHQADGYRDTGCEPAQQVQITNEEGEYLYSNNPTCPDVGGAGIAADNELFNPKQVDAEEGDGPVVELPVDPETPCKSCVADAS